MSVKKVIDCIRKHNRFLITSHRNLEGDALGSQIAFYYLLKKLGKSAVMVDQDAIPCEYAFLRGARLIKKYRENMKLKFDVLAMLDCSDISRCGCVANLNVSGRPILNIDHHISNQGFGDFNWVLPDASSASELVFRLYKITRVKMDFAVAEALYVGILTDTGSFRYVNTTFFTHQMAAELLKFNLDVSGIYRNIYGSVSFSDMSLLARILLTMQEEVSGKIITFNIQQKHLRSGRVYFDFSEKILSFGRSVRGSEVCVLFKQQQGKLTQFRVNLRSQGKVDVNRVARFFGGGGHKTASGCTVNGNLEMVRKKVIDKIKEQL